MSNTAPELEAPSAAPIQCTLRQAFFWLTVFAVVMFLIRKPLGYLLADGTVRWEVVPQYLDDPFTPITYLLDIDVAESSLPPPAHRSAYGGATTLVIGVLTTGGAIASLVVHLELLVLSLWLLNWGCKWAYGYEFMPDCSDDAKCPRWFEWVAGCLIYGSPVYAVVMIALSRFSGGSG